MPLFGDLYVAHYEGHTLELLRNNWNKTLSLLIDGEVVDSTSCHLPGSITLTGTLRQGNVSREVVARSIPRKLIFTTDTISIDGKSIP